ncbi:MAG: MFS transporter [Dehalococcoidia bacterium]|nr:MFS transporter [Dehalococcoidia bacterium]
MALTLRSAAPSRVMTFSGRFHYAWIIVAILATVQMIAQSISMSAGITVAPLNDPEGGFGWSMRTIGAALMVYYLVGAVFAPVSGWLGDRYGPRIVMLWAGIIYGGSMVLLGLTKEPWQFFITFGVMLSVTQSLAMVPLMASVSGWFRRRLGLGVGLLWAAGGAGAATLPPLMAFLLSQFGWQGTFWIIGAVGGGVTILLTAIFRNGPKEVGLTPYGASTDYEPEPPRSRQADQLRSKVFNQHIRKTRAFWNLPLIHGLGCAGHGIVLIYTIPIAIDAGIDFVTASVILSLISLLSVGGRLITPILAERFGGKQIMGVAMFIQGITVLVVFWAQDVWSFYLFAILFGIGFGGEMSAYLVVNRQYFGTGPISTCYGFQTMGALLGHAAATGLAGLIIYVTGSFGVVLTLSMVFSLLGVLVIFNLESSTRVLIPDWEKSLPRDARSAPPAAPLLASHQE